FLKDYPQSGLADNACYNLAKIALSRGNEKKALDWYEYLLENYPDTDAAYFGKDEYVELSRSLGKGPSEIADECYFNGKKLLQKNKLAEAEAEFNRLISEYPNCEYVDNAHYQLGLICKKRGDKEGVKRHVDIILTQYADTDAALYARGLLV
ncbi:MAG: tetratricopeptide repeat protein, partial [Candidatus Riflebacteria bacterium]|nr:tetratricopeptide repeat protein [Candidatus Riflebacteria bacterium]